MNNPVPSPYGFAAVAQRRWRLLAASFLGGCVLGLGASYLMRPVYKAEVLLLPVTGDDSLDRVSSALAGIGGVGALLGLAPQKVATTEAIETLRSPSFIREFLLSKDVVADVRTPGWIFWPAGTVRPEDTILVQEKAVERFRTRVMNVSEDRRTGVIRLQIFWFDPQVAAAWANELTRRTNELLRERALEESNKRLDYLRSQAEATNVSAIKEGIYKVIESEIRNVTIASSRADFAMRVIDPAFPPHPYDRVAPDRLAFALIAGLGGLALGMLKLWAGLRNQLSATR